MNPKSIKEEACKLIDELPPTATWEDFYQEVCRRAKLEREAAGMKLAPELEFLMAEPGAEYDAEPATEKTGKSKQ